MAIGFVDCVKDDESRDPSKKPSKSGRANRVVFRRHVVTVKSLHGYTAPMISKFIEDNYPDVPHSEATILEDIEFLRMQWRTNAERTMDECITAELVKYDQLEQTVLELHDAGELKDSAELMIKVIKGRRSLLGLDKAKKIEIHDGRLDELPTADLLRIISEFNERAIAEGSPQGSIVGVLSSSPAKRERLADRLRRGDVSLVQGELVPSSDSGILGGPDERDPD